MKKSMVLSTPAGILEVKAHEDINYPGFRVYLNGELITITEYSSDYSTVRTISYSEESDDPISITDYKNNVA